MINDVRAFAQPMFLYSLNRMIKTLTNKLSNKQEITLMLNQNNRANLLKLKFIKLKRKQEHGNTTTQRGIIMSG